MGLGVHFFGREWLLRPIQVAGTIGRRVSVTSICFSTQDILKSSFHRWIKWRQRSRLEKSNAIQFWDLRALLGKLTPYISRFNYKFIHFKGVLWLNFLIYGQNEMLNENRNFESFIASLSLSRWADLESSWATLEGHWNAMGNNRSFQHTNVDCLNTTTYANPLYANLISVYMLNIEKPSYYFTVSFPFNIYIEASSKSDSPSEPAYNQVCFRCFLKCHQRSALKM